MISLGFMPKIMQEHLSTFGGKVPPNAFGCAFQYRFQFRRGFAEIVLQGVCPADYPYTKQDNNQTGSHDPKALFAYSLPFACEYT